MLSQLRIFAYLSVLLSSLALIWRHFVGRPHSFRHGWFVASAIVALVCGLILLPLSLAGLALLFGVLGFVPFGTAYIYYRNARDMFKGLSKIQIRNSVCGFMMYLRNC